jgi:hypothetical protein
LDCFAFQVRGYLGADAGPSGISARPIGLEKTSSHRGRNFDDDG